MKWGLIVVFILVGCAREQEPVTIAAAAPAAQSRSLSREEITAIVRKVVGDEIEASKEREAQESIAVLKQAQAAESAEREARIAADANAALEHDRRAKEDATTLLSAEELERVKKIRIALKDNGFWTVSSDDLFFASYGDAAPLLYEAVADSLKANKGETFMSKLSDRLQLNEKERLEATLDRDENMRAWLVRLELLNSIDEEKDILHPTIRQWRNDKYLRQPLLDYLRKKKQSRQL